MSVSLGYSYFKNMQSVQMVIEWFNRGKSNVGIFFSASSFINSLRYIYS
uniref:Uncharacterized protein n=1 Tax=Anguilla anguilla TaxID=7936 RepID=A0A0E9PM85_ANGAN